MASPPPSRLEKQAVFYYAGLPSSPRFLASTSTIPWEEPKGRWAYPEPKQLGIVINHKLNTAWENDVALKVHTCLDEMKVEWTSTDIVRIGEVEGSFAPVILWIGVKPKSLTSEDAATAAFRCLDVLKESGITDVDVEFRESSVTRSAGPKLLRPVYSYHPTVAVRDPLTHALCLPISARATPYAAGTGGFFMAEGGGSNKLLLVTARHVVFPPNREKNVKFERKNESQPRFDILLLGDAAYESCLASIKARIGAHGFDVEYAKRCIKAVEGLNDEDAAAERREGQREIDKAEKAMPALYNFYNEVEENWATHASRVLGHVVCSPPIRLGVGNADEQYTEDYAIIQVDDDKIDRTKFEGNVIDLGTEISAGEFVHKMCPNYLKYSPETNFFRYPRDPNSFQYPHDRLLKLSGTISDKEMRHPTTLDQNGEPSMMVIKDGSTTGVTIGRASGIMSYVREYCDDGSHQTSKEWAILPYDSKSGAFSNSGDSGAVIVDGLGRIGGLLTGAAGYTDSSDITYATPIDFLLKSIKANGYPNVHLNLA